MGTTKRILVVDDEETLCDILGFNLESEGYEVETAYSAEEALRHNLSEYDLVLLDIMMGEISGTQLARIMKSNPATKPYSLKPVLARVRAVLRRVSAPAAVTPPDDETVMYGGLVLSVRKRTCTVDGNEVKMPKKEFEILLKLVSNIGKVFSRSELIDEIWPDEVVVLDRVVDVNIRRIRQKIGEYGRHIVTRSGYGYGFIE